MLKDYINYFFHGTSNTLHSTNFEDDFELNTQGLLSDKQKDFITTAVKVEKRVNLFFAVLAMIFMFFVVPYATFTLIYRTVQINNG